MNENLKEKIVEEAVKQGADKQLAIDLLHQIEIEPRSFIVKEEGDLLDCLETNDQDQMLVDDLIKKLEQYRGLYILPTWNYCTLENAPICELRTESEDAVVVRCGYKLYQQCCDYNAALAKEKEKKNKKIAALEAELKKLKGK